MASFSSQISFHRHQQTQ
jgi:cell wall-associated NlpC family hydrolase